MRPTTKQSADHGHDVDLSDIEAAVKDLQERVTALEDAATDPDPQPPASWDRIIPAGSYGDITINNENGAKRWLFEPGAIVKGRVPLAGVDLLIEGLHTTSEQCHETAPLIQKGSSGVLRKHLIENIGSPGNGMGYSSISADDDGDPNGGWAGPWTFEDDVFDQRDNGWYGAETWGIRGAKVLRNLFKGKGGRPNPNAPGKYGENGFMSPPRSHDMLIEGNTFDMTQGCYRVIELVEMLRCSFVNNTILNLRGDVLPMNGGGSGKCSGHRITGNRVSCVSSGVRLFVGLAGDGHTITDNRLNTGVTPFSGSATNTYKANNGPQYGPAW